MKISLVTVTFNSAKTLCDTIHSVLSQSYTDIEYIIVDGLRCPLFFMQWR